MFEIQSLLMILALLLTPYIGIMMILAIFSRRVKLKKSYKYQPTVTVFLPTYNEERLIGQKLEDLTSQTYPLTEILVYDCSTDKTPLIVREYQKQFPMIKLIRQPERIGMARTLNQAFREANGEIFIKTDCDSVALSRDGVKEIIANFADRTVGGATGICIAEGGVEKYFRKFMTAIQIAETNIDSTIIAHAASILAFRHSLVEPVNESSMADDTEEFVAIRKKGYRTVVDPSVVSREEVPNDFGMRRLQKDRRSQGIIRVLAENASMLFNPKYGMFGFAAMPLEFFILVISPFVLLAFAITIAFILYSIQPLLILALAIPLGLGFIHKSNMIHAIIDTQISGLVGTAMNLSKRDSSLWVKVR